ncbi:MAG: AraC family transcriptional regulator [Alphaproteobacteria bacterium]|nr:AraC family transcriptional regulator [Alphaproteobacteria bacterium]
MTQALAVRHGPFGRACLYRMNKALATHAHREGHLTFLVQGTPFRHKIANGMFNSSGVEAVAINPWEPHDFRPVDVCDGALILVLYIRPTWFSSEGNGKSSPLRFGRTQIEVTHTVHRYVHHITGMLLNDESSDLLDGYLYELTRDCFEQSWQRQPDDGPPEKPEYDSVTDFRVRKSIRIISEKVGSEIVLDDVARESGLSRPHFYKLFREQIGITPNLFLNTLRMEKALDYLATTSMTVTDISFDLGFSSQSGFTRFFSSNVGLAPSDYRRVAHVLNG